MEARSSARVGYIAMKMERRSLWYACNLDRYKEHGMPWLVDVLKRLPQKTEEHSHPGQLSWPPNKPGFFILWENQGSATGAKGQPSWPSEMKDNVFISMWANLWIYFIQVVLRHPVLHGEPSSVFQEEASNTPNGAGSRGTSHLARGWRTWGCEDKSSVHPCQCQQALVRTRDRVCEHGPCSQGQECISTVCSGLQGCRLVRPVIPGIWSQKTVLGVNIVPINGRCYRIHQSSACSTDVVMKNLGFFFTKFLCFFPC